MSVFLYDNLSVEQRRFCALELKTPGSPCRVVVFAVRFSGKLDQNALQRAVNAIVERHSALRTIFSVEDERTIPAVLPPGPVGISEENWTQLQAGEVDSFIERRIHQEYQKPFPFPAGPFLRLSLLCFGPDHYLFIAAAHASVFDYPSADIFRTELLKFYEAHVRGEPSSMPNFTSQEPDSGYWRRQFLAGVTKDTHLAYWKNQLSGDLANLQMPADRPRQAVAPPPSASMPITLEGAVFEALLRYSEERGTAPKNTLLAAFFILLYRYTYQEDILVGIPVTGRATAETKGRIGRLSYPLVIRSGLSGDLDFASLLEQIGRTLSESEENGDVPFGQLREGLRDSVGPEDSSRHPLFQALFNYVDLPESWKADGIDVIPVSAYHPESEVDLGFHIEFWQRRARISAHYSKDLYDAGTIERMLTHFQNILSGALSEPNRPISQLEILSPAEKHQILKEWNQTSRIYPVDIGIHRLFELQAERTPEQQALLFAGDGSSLTYAELDRQANLVARKLISLGARPETIVAISMDRSLEMIIGILGILKAGAAFLPIDPAYPKDRVIFMLTDAQAPILLTQKKYAGELSSYVHNCVCLDTDWGSIAGGNDTNPRVPVSDRNLAYVIYTSGSTGRPKGVLLEHRGLCNLAIHQSRVLRVNTRNRVLQFASSSFDASVAEIFVSLIAGATLVLAPAASLLPGPFLIDLLLSHSVDIATLPPSVLSVSTPEELAGIRTLISAGESCSADLAKRWSAGRRFFNAYGPTEATVCATMEECTESTERPAIGRPISNVRVYVVDSTNALVPIGVPGELWIGGAGIARGYINQPELTAQRFMKNPFSDQPDEHIYRTGDLVRWLANGKIDYLGRFDNQVKIRGYRIELEEIEAVISQHAGVRECVVLAREVIEGDKRLAAYVVCYEPDGLSTAELKSHIEQKLPAFMVPSSIIFLDKMPLSPNGKVNRKALPLPRGKIKEQRAQDEQVLAAHAKAYPPSALVESPAQLNCRQIESVLAQHHAIRKVIVVTSAGLSSERSTIAAYWFGRGNARPSPDELKTYLKERLPPDLVPDAIVSIATEQERFCAIEAANPGHPQCISIYTCRLTGALDGKAFRASVDEVVRKNSILRTTFPSINGWITRRVERAMTVDVEEINLSLLPESEWDGEILREIDDELSRPFNMVAGPLIRLTLLRFAREEHVLVLAGHAAIMDEPSAEIFLRAVFDAYARERGERTTALSEPPPSIDEARRVRQWLQEANIASHLPYWNGVTSSHIEDIEWPNLGSRSPESSGLRFASATLDLQDGLYEQLEALSERLNINLFTLLLAAYAVLLHRYTGKDELPIGVPVSGRVSSAQENAMGRFRHPVVIQAKINSHSPFRDVAADINRALNEALSHKNVPFATVEQHLGLSLESGHETLLPTMFDLKLQPPEVVEIGGIRVSRLDLRHISEDTDLSYCLTRSQNGLCTHVSYSMRRFDEAVIEQMLLNWGVLLSSIASEQPVCVGKLQILTEQERREILVYWNATATEYPREASVQSLFEAWVERNPYGVAASMDDDEISYDTLNRRANCVANWLIGQNLGKGSVVGILAERSLDTIAVIVGIVKAGAIYLPIDPSYPADRIAFMLNNAGASLVVVGEGMNAALSAWFRTIDIKSILWSGSGEKNPLDTTHATDLAYIMFTSGSTGQPKGVEVTHRGIVRLVIRTNYIDFNAQDRVAHLSNLSFDASTFEIWGALLNGARLIVVSKDALLSPELFKSKILTESITVMFLTTALFHHYAGLLKGAFGNLRYLVVGGDALSSRWAREVLEHNPPENLVNGYGPTENTVFSTAEKVFYTLGDDSIVPIGYPISNSTAYIVNAFYEPVPPGVVGELYVGGDGVARGYRNLPELTQEKFIRDIFANKEDSYMYKTGDRARFLANGRIEFLGRVDEQVKIRGFRVEPGEIEAVLSSNPLVHQVAVRVWANRLGEKYLAAYVSPIESGALSVNDLNVFLERRLPFYMIPPVIVVMSVMPMTPNGKINRRELAEPLVFTEQSRDLRREDTSPTEKMLATIWRDSLGLDDVGLDDNFYFIGGHSLAMLRMRSRISEEAGVNIPLDIAFNNPTIRKLAAWIDRSFGSTAAGAGASQIARVDRTKPIPLSYFQQQIWLVLQSDPSNPVYNEPMTISITGPLDADILERSLAEIVERHEILRVAFSGSGRVPTQAVAVEQPFALGRFDLTDIPADEKEAEAVRLAMIEAKQPFLLSKGPLFRATLMKLSEDAHKLFLVMHHMITDGISVQRILPRELRGIYEAFLKGEPCPFAKLPVQYLDYAVWQRKTKTPETLAAHMEYWEQKLVNIPILELPLDRPRRPVQSFKGAKYYTSIPNDLLEGLKKIGHEEESTLFMVVLAVFNVLMGRYSGQDDIVIGTAISARDLPELENLIGHFVNSIVLRTSLKDNPPFRELVRRVRNAAIEAYAHGDVPFEMLVEELRIPQVRSQNPVFQVGFVLEPPLDQDTSNWIMSQYDVDIGVSKTDLTVHLEERMDGTIVRFEYSSALFDRSAIEGMATSFLCLLESAVLRPDLRLSELTILDGRRQKLLMEWSGQPFVPTSKLCLHELFDEQVKLHHDKTAVHFSDMKLSYDELCSSANQLANYFLEIGIQQGDLIGLCIDRDIEVYIAIIAILKAGAAYVPLDPSEPSLRLALLLGEARPSLVLTTRHHVDKFAGFGAEVYCLDNPSGLWKHQSAEAPKCRVQPTDIAYVLFRVAGSGRPRGVMISHQNIVTLFESVRSLFDFNSGDVWTAFHSCSVDFSVWEMWGALLHGGTLVGVSYEVSRSTEAFYSVLLTHHVTVVNHTPSAFRHLMMVEEAPDIESWRLRLRYVYLSGEVLDVRMLRAWFERHGDDTPAIYNLYGLTAATGMATVRRIKNKDIGDNNAGNIGVPIPGAEVFVLDSYRQLVPPGVFGELFIGGISLSKGYYGNSELTAERFILNPFSSEPNARLYRTGDRARFLLNGEIEFTGRIDQQIRVRGFRIDPAEVESALVNHPLIREASVIVREDTAGDQRLVAYYVKRSDQILTTNELRGFLRNRLPDYMIPTLYIAVPTISFISNGNVDRRTLPAPDRNRPSMAPIFRLPSNAVEVLLRSIWVRLLQVDEIGVKDDFFSLGGHSLLAAQMIARVRETFKIQIQHSNFLMRTFLENPTISAFSKVIELLREATPSLKARHNGTINYEAEAMLDGTINFDAPLVEGWADPATILLTGATGFLGAFLLDELLRRTRAQIYCLVRAPDAALGMERIRKSMRELGLWDGTREHRIVAIPGDQSRPLLGLKPEIFEELSQIIDVIYHNGAHVNFIYPYSALRSSNVGGTMEIIRLAAAHRRKPVHYMSTLAILVGFGFYGVREVHEDTPLAHADHLFMGYPETKWVSEKLLMNASAAGLPVSIYRPHDVTGHFSTGAWRADGFLCSFLRTLIELQCAPDINMPMDFAPVDFVTAATVHIALHENPCGKVYHLNNKQYRLLPWMVERMTSAGYNVDLLPQHEWVQRLLDYTTREPGALISPFVSLFVERWGQQQRTMLEMYSEEHIPAFTCTNSEKALEGTGIVCPPVDDKMIDKYFEYFVKVGFLSKPSK